jgi:flagellar FliJ protein
MADGLKNMIRVNEFSVDEKRRNLGELLKLMEDLEQRQQDLEKEVANEQRIASSLPGEADLYYGVYAGTVIDRRERIAESIKQMEVKVVTARDEMGEAYVELKKYEIAQKNRDKKEALEESRREQSILDEIGLNAHRRKKHSAT